jgi:integrase/recombinase XerC
VAFSMQLQYPEIEPFISYIRFQKRYSTHTVTAYITDLEQLFAYLSSQFNGVPIQEITSPILRSWLAELKEDHLTAKSIARKLSTLKAFFKYLQKQEQISTNPAAQLTAPKLSKRLPHFLKEEEIVGLLRPDAFEDTWKGKTNYLVIKLFYASGMRLSELCKLKEAQIDAYYKHIKVLGKGNKERIIPLPEELVEELKDYIAEKPKVLEGVQEVFIQENGKALYPKFIYTEVKNTLTKVTTQSKKSPHVLRHSFATHLLNHGADINAVKELLGHSSLAATQVYTHNTIEKLKDAFNKAHPKA